MRASVWVWASVPVCVRHSADKRRCMHRKKTSPICKTSQKESDRVHTHIQLVWMKTTISWMRTISRCTAVDTNWQTHQNFFCYLSAFTCKQHTWFVWNNNWIPKTDNNKKCPNCKDYTAIVILYSVYRLLCGVHMPNLITLNLLPSQAAAPPPPPSLLFSPAPHSSASWFHSRYCWDMFHICLYL